MNISMLLKNDSFNYKYNDGKLPFFDLLLKIQETKELITNSGEKTFRDERVYNEEVFRDVPLYEILFDKDIQKIVGLTHEEVKMLSLLIDHNTPIIEDDYNRIVENIITGKSNSPDYALLCFYSLGASPFHVSTQNPLLKVKRDFLHLIEEPYKFIKACNYCFPNLYFHSNIIDSMKSLSAPFKIYKKEIIKHLIAINDIFYPIYNKNHSNGIYENLQILQAIGEIKCSLEGNSQSAKKRLMFNFVNDSNQIEEVLCEPHTKLEGTNFSGDTVYRFDRIYFHSGKNNIENGKILIAHIGKHL